MEKIGNLVGTALESIPYIKYFAGLGKLRSSGITDLRYGNICESDWRGQKKFSRTKDNRLIIPLSEQINHIAFAAHLGKQPRKLNYHVLGDGLVQVNSALGVHKQPERNLGFSATQKMILPNMGHFDLLRSRMVSDTIKRQLAR